MIQGKLGSTVISWTVVYPEPAWTGHERMREMASSLCNTIWGGQDGVNNVSKRCGFHKKKLWVLPDLLVSSPHPHSHWKLPLRRHLLKIADFFKEPHSMLVTLLTRPHERQERVPVLSDRYASIFEAPG